MRSDIVPGGIFPKYVRQPNNVAPEQRRGQGAGLSRSLSQRAGQSGATPPGSPCNGAHNIGNGEVSSAWSPRIVQLALKLLF